MARVTPKIRGRAWRGKAWLGRARLGLGYTEYFLAGRGVARRGAAWQGKARVTPKFLGRIWLGTASAWLGLHRDLPGGTPGSRPWTGR
jgi:hypothetical protein